MKNWRCFSVLAAALPLALATSVSVHAQSADGYLNDDTPLYAGPAPEYPEIEGLPYGTYVSVQGCTEGWEWCDVIAEQGDRGWVPGDYIDYVYEGEPVVVTEYGPRIGIPIVSFSITNYWSEHYRNRPFYRERSTWVHRNIPQHAPAPPHRAASRRPPPPPPPGGWHHGGHASQHEGAQSQHHAYAPATSPRHETSGTIHQGYAPAAPRHETSPSPARAPASQPEYPRGDHHANIPTPQGAPSHPAPHTRHVQRPHPASSSGHDHRPPQHPRKKDDHDNDGDNGH